MILSSSYSPSKNTHKNSRKHLSLWRWPQGATSTSEILKIWWGRILHLLHSISSGKMSTWRLHTEHFGSVSNICFRMQSACPECPHLRTMIFLVFKSSWQIGHNSASFSISILSWGASSSSCGASASLCSFWSSTSKSLAPFSRLQTRSLRTRLYPRIDTS